MSLTMGNCEYDFLSLLSIEKVNYGTVEARIKSNKIVIGVTDQASPLGKVMKLAGGGYRGGNRVTE